MIATENVHDRQHIPEDLVFIFAFSACPLSRLDVVSEHLVRELDEAVPYFQSEHCISGEDLIYTALCE